MSYLEAFQSAIEQPARLCACKLIEAACPPCRAMVVTGQYDGARYGHAEVPESRQRFPVQSHVRDQVRKKTLLLIRLRDRDLR